MERHHGETAMTQIDHDHALKYAQATEPPVRRPSVLYRVLVALCAVPLIYLGGRFIIAPVIGMK
jgi:hypothetical protein